MGSLAPIALFTYNRPRHTKVVIEALRRNALAPESELFVYSDGPRTSEDQDKVQKVRDYIQTIEGFRSVTLIIRNENLGLSRSIIAGVTELVNKFGRIIVLEDDLVTAPYFLQYMNDALELYENEDRVISVVGYVYLVRSILPETFFIKGADCWGWATWKRGWDLFEKDGGALLGQLKEKRQLKEFDFDGAYPFTKMLMDQIVGKNNSWAIRWYASAFLRDKLSLHPGRSLVQNIGIDGTGINSGKDYSFMNPDFAKSAIALKKVVISEDSGARKAFEEFFRRKRSFFVRLKSRIKRVLSFGTISCGVSFGDV